MRMTSYLRPRLSGAPSPSPRAPNGDLEDRGQLLRHGRQGRHERLALGVREEQHLERVRVVDGHSSARQAASSVSHLAVLHLH